MSIKELNSWFNSLDSFELEIMFPGEFTKTMESANPNVNVNTFYKEVKALWKSMSKEEKENLYEQFK